MFDSKLPKNTWDLALLAAINVYNRTLHRSINYNVPLRHFALHVHCHTEQLQHFGCFCYPKIQRVPESKFSFQAICGILVGYTNTAYQILQPERGNILESQNVCFNEKLVYGDKFGPGAIKNWPKDVTGTSMKKRGRPPKKKPNGVSVTSVKVVSKKQGRPRKMEHESGINNLQRDANNLQAKTKKRKLDTKQITNGK